MRSLLAAVAVASLVGCAAQAPSEPPSPASDVPADPATSPDTSGDDDTQLTPVEATPPVTPAPAPSSSTPPATDTPPPSAQLTTKSGTCTSTTGDYKSVASVTYTIDDTGTIRVTAMTVDVTNPANRDKNDVDVYVTPSGGEEKKAFNSGDILTHDKAVAVPQATALITTTGAALRLSTNFDKAFASDPAASCAIVF